MGEPGAVGRVARRRCHRRWARGWGSAGGSCSYRAARAAAISAFGSSHAHAPRGPRGQASTAPARPQAAPATSKKFATYSVVNFFGDAAEPAATQSKAVLRTPGARAAAARVLLAAD